MLEWALIRGGRMSVTPLWPVCIAVDSTVMHFARSHGIKDGGLAVIIALPCAGNHQVPAGGIPATLQAVIALTAKRDLPKLHPSLACALEVEYLQSSSVSAILLWLFVMHQQAM